MQAPEKKRIIPKTLSQSIYDHLKDSIIKNELKAGQRISEKEIADIFDVSTTPVREAVLKLGSEGYITIDSHRKAVVKDISYQELAGLYELFSVVESFAAGIIVEQIKPQQLSTVEKLTKEMDTYAHRDSVETYLELNVIIHNEIWKGLPDNILRKTLHFLNSQFLRYNHARFFLFRDNVLLQRSCRDHFKIVEYLKTRDKAKLVKLIRNHWILLTPPSLQEGFEKYLRIYNGR